MKERKTNNYGMLLHVVCACLHVSVSFVYMYLSVCLNFTHWASVCVFLFNHPPC